jgi:quinol monooxygenase YgiN
MAMYRLFGVALAAGLIAGSAPIRAQETSASYVVSYIEVAPSARAAAIPLLRALRDASRKEAGNGGFEVLARLGQSQFAILEVWQDGKAQGAHAAGAAATQFHDTMKRYLAAPIDERPSTGYAVGQAKAGRAGVVYAVTHVDLIGAKKDEGIAALKQLRIDSAQETGNLRYDIWQQGNRPNHLTVIEVWRGKAALVAHEAADHTRKFRAALLPMSGALFDQRLYRAID